MYTTCPKCAYERRPTDAAPAGECPACGLLFAKWMRRRFRPPAVEENGPEPAPAAIGGRLLAHLLYVPGGTNPVMFWSRVAVFIGLFVWGWQFILMDHEVVVAGYPPINESFLHRPNLIFHEAGHILFLPFGRFMSILGGTLGQLLMPAVVLGVFIVKERNNFGASVGLWWLAQSLMDVAPYINDARAGRIILLGGGTGGDRPGFHDWNNILGDLGLLAHDRAIASAVDGAGVALMLIAFGWGAATLAAQYRRLDRRR